MGFRCLKFSSYKIYNNKFFDFVGIRQFASAFDGLEPDGPHVKTEIPGPKTKQLIKDISQIQVTNFSYPIFQLVTVLILCLFFVA